MHRVSASEQDTPERWVLCFLVTADHESVMAVSAEGLIKTTLLGHPEGAKPIVSTVTRFADLSDEEQDRWHLLLRREVEDL